MPNKISSKNINETNRYNETPLFQAVIKNEDIKPLLDLNADLDHQDHTGYTALMWVALLGHSEQVNHLISAKANLNKQNMSCSQSALTFAIRSERSNCY